MLLCDEGEECLEFKSGLTCEERRKLKKKLNKKRRKEKAAENQRTSFSTQARPAGRSATSFRNFTRGRQGLRTTAAVSRSWSSSSIITTSGTTWTS